MCINLTGSVGRMVSSVLADNHTQAMRWSPMTYPTSRLTPSTSLLWPLDQRLPMVACGNFLNQAVRDSSKRTILLDKKSLLVPLIENIHFIFLNCSGHDFLCDCGRWWLWEVLAVVIWQEYTGLQCQIMWTFETRAVKFNVQYKSTGMVIQFLIQWCHSEMFSSLP